MRYLSAIVIAASLIGCGEDDGNSTPETVLESTPPTLTNLASAMFFFHSEGPSTEFQCSIDANILSNCISPVTLEALADGEHTFVVAAQFRRNVDLTPATYTWRIDTAPPDTTISSAPPALDNAVAPVIEFSGSDAEGPVTFECALDGATPAPCTSPSTLAVGDGNHGFSVVAIDAAGNRDPSPATHDWQVTTAAPDTSFLVAPAVGSTTGADVTFTFSSPDANATFECSLDGATFTACTSPQSMTLADGAHTFAVRAVGVAGADPSPATIAWTVDATPPAVTITTNPANPSNDTTPQFAFTATETATFECQIDGVAAFAACTSPFESPSLADGGKTFRVRATDTVGNVGTAQTFAWVVDTVAPTVTITAQPSALSADSTPTVTFTTAGNPTLTECSVDGGAFAACTSPFTATVTDGTHTITVRVTDTATNSSSATTNQFAVDTVVPTVTITNQPSAATNDDTPTVTFTTTDNPAIVQCRVNNAAFGTCTSPFTSAQLANGTHTITVRVADLAGNASTATTAQFTIDTIAPTVTINTQPGALSNDSTPSVTFTTAGSPTAIECQVDTGAFAACTSPFTSAALADGNHTITVRVTDAATNSSSATTSTFAIDTAAPTVTITSQPAALSNDNTPTVAFTTAGNPTTIQCQVDAGAFAACTSPFTPAAAVGDGNHTITVRVTDAANNSSTATTNQFAIDTAAPTVTITAQPAAISNDSTPSVSFTTAGNPTAIECRVDGGAFAACTSPFTSAVLADGNHTIAVRVTDGATNSSTATTNTFTIDTIAPTVTINTQPAALSNDTTPTMTFTTAGNPTVVECQLDTGAFSNCASGSFTPAATAGTHTMTVRVVDGATNASSATTNQFVIDTTGPTVTFTDAPPADWPVDYYDIAFTANETGSTFECSLDGAAFAACTSPRSVKTTYNIASTFRVRARDSLGNLGSIATTNWTSTPGLVLHYAWEQGSTANSSLLAQRPAFSPDGTITAPFVGGWAGTALGNSVGAHQYARTNRPLSSAPLAGNYTATFWLRTNSDLGNGTVLSTLGTSSGFRLTLQGNVMVLCVQDTALRCTETSIPMNRWIHVALRATGPGKGLQLWIDGNLFALIDAQGTGFDAGQASAMTVGPFSGFDIDDLRFFNKSFTDTEICTLLARGTFSPNGCFAPFSPGFEVDFEGDRVNDTGFWGLSLAQPQIQQFGTGPTGGNMFLPDVIGWGYPGGFRNNAVSAPGRSYSLWFTASTTNSGTLIDFAQKCNANTTNDCGMRIFYNNQNSTIAVFTGTTTVQKTTPVPVRFGKRNSVVVTEQFSNGTTVSVSVYINGEAPTVIPIGSGSIYTTCADSVQLLAGANITVDEYEFWPLDLSKDDELLCENGFDGLFDPVDGSCGLTANDP